jgi:hypothetical protein
MAAGELRKQGNKGNNKAAVEMRKTRRELC